MNKVKGMLIVSLSIIVLLTITGCGNKVALSSDEFKSKMESNNFNVQDASNQMSEYDYVEKVYIAISSDGTYQIEFYELSDNDSAISFFNNNKEVFENSKTSASAESSVAIGNNNKYTLTANGEFKVVSRIDNTVIYLNVDDNNKKSVKTILDDLGY